MMLYDARDNFIYDKRLKNCSDSTVRDYHFFIKVFLDYCGNKEVDSLTLDDVQKYILDLYSRKLSAATYHTYIHHLRIFLSWCSKKVTMKFDPSEIVVPKSPKKQLRIYSDDDIRLIYQTDCTNNEELNARNRALISLMLDSGLRQMELCNIRPCDLDFTAKRLKVLGKGNKERFVPLGRVTIALINHYLALAPIDNRKTLFCSKYGEPLTTNAVKLFMRKMAALLPFEFSSHKLRHNFATNYCIDQLEKNNVVDTYSLMLIMGHESIETTERYVHVAKEILASKSCISHVDSILLDSLGIISA
jgi:site-specific recombinase XerD